MRGLYGFISYHEGFISYHHNDNIERTTNYIHWRTNNISHSLHHHHHHHHLSPWISLYAAYNDICMYVWYIISIPFFLANWMAASPATPAPTTNTFAGWILPTRYQHVYTYIYTHSYIYLCLWRSYNILIMYNINITIINSRYHRFIAI